MRGSEGTAELAASGVRASVAARLDRDLDLDLDLDPDLDPEVAMPAPTVDRALVLHVAKLASLSLSGEEADRFARELEAIVAYVAQLEAVDTTGVPPTAHVQLDRTPLRADEPRPGLTHEEALARAPRVEDGGFAVPAFVEEK